VALLRSKEDAVAVVVEGETRHLYIRHHEENAQAVVYKDFYECLGRLYIDFSELE